MNSIRMGVAFWGLGFGKLANMAIWDSQLKENPKLQPPLKKYRA